MNRQLFSLFNVVCLGLTGFFLLGTMYVWRGEFASAKTNDVVEKIPVVSYAEVRDTTDEVRMDEEIVVQETAVVSTTEQEPVFREETEPAEKKPLVPIDQLPAQINLAVPFTSQAPEKNWDQPWQDACEEAAVLMVDAYYEGYGLSPIFSRDEILRLLAYEEKFDWGGSIEIEKIDQLFNYWTLVPGLQSIILENPTIDDIKQQVASGRPVLVVADGKILPNQYFQNGGPVYHALVVRGYTEDSFITNDPGTQFGENFLYKYKDLMAAIRDWNGGDVKNGKRAVLVFE